MATIDIYLTAAEHLLQTAELTHLKLQNRENSAEGYVTRNRCSLTEEALLTFSVADVARIDSFEALLTSRMNTNPVEAESYVKAARYTQQHTVLCRMIAERMEDSPETDALRDSMDGNWNGMPNDTEFRSAYDELHQWIGNGYGIWKKMKSG